MNILLCQTTSQTDYQIPTEVENELIGLREADTLIRFRIGKIVNEQYELNKGRGVTKEKIEYKIARVLGKSVFTVRNYALVARKISTEIWEEYGDVLPFETFRFACKTVFEDGGLWKDVLDYAIDNFPVTVDQLEAIFYPKVAYKTLTDLQTAPNPTENPRLPAEKQAIVFTSTPALFQKFRSYIYANLRRTPLTKTQYRELNQAMHTIKKILHNM